MQFPNAASIRFLWKSHVERVGLKFYAVGRRRPVSTFVDKEQKKIRYTCCLILRPRRRTLGASPHSVGFQSHALDGDL